MIASQVILAVGLLLIVFGLSKRRKGDALHCRRCNALIPTPRTRSCPGCARRLTRKHALARGELYRCPEFWIPGLVAAAGGLIWFGLECRHLVTGPFWQLRAPEWWLIEIEARYASGTRLAETAKELRAGARAGRRTGTAYAQACEIGYNRVISSTTTPPTTDPTLLEFADMWLLDKGPDKVDLNALAATVRRFITHDPYAPNDAVPPSPSKPVCTFLPSFITLQYYVLAPDRNDPTLLNRHDGRLYNGNFRARLDTAHQGRASGFTPGPGRQTWNYSLTVPNEPNPPKPLLTWTAQYQWTSGAPASPAAPVTPAGATPAAP